MLQIKILAFKNVFIYFSSITFNYLYIMITLFISKGEIIYTLILLGLLVLYALSKYMMVKLEEWDALTRNMSDEELVNRFHRLVEEYDKEATYEKGQELSHLLAARKRRKLLDKVSDTELTDCYYRLLAKYGQTPTYWKKKELAYYRKEMEKRHLL